VLKNRPILLAAGAITLLGVLLAILVRFRWPARPLTEDELKSEKLRAEGIARGELNPKTSSVNWDERLICDNQETYNWIRKSLDSSTIQTCPYQTIFIKHSQTGVADPFFTNDNTLFHDKREILYDRQPGEILFIIVPQDAERSDLLLNNSSNYEFRVKRLDGGNEPPGLTGLHFKILPFRRFRDWFAEPSLNSTELLYFSTTQFKI
jgi:hypothetical protein